MDMQTVPAWAAETAAAIETKLGLVAHRSRGILPYTTENGRFDDMRGKNPCWWTNGFWGGILWQMYAYSGKPLYRELAIENELALDGNLMDPYGMDHDSGFKWMPTAVAHFRLEGDGDSLRRGLLAAENLAGRFNPAGNYIRAWNDGNDGSTAGWAIIDCMMNLPLLYWAYAQTRDPRFCHIATAHADTVRERFIRADGTAIHIGVFDPRSGEFLHSLPGQGYGEGSAWTRGQAWALYGFTLSWLHTRKREYLDTARRVADAFLARMRPGRGIPVDFCQPETCAREDSSAAAIAACGLLELSWALPAVQADGSVYREAALRLLDYLRENCLNLDGDVDFLLANGADSYHSDRAQMTLIYGDYFFVEAVWKLIGRDIGIWMG